MEEPLTSVDELLDRLENGEDTDVTTIRVDATSCSPEQFLQILDALLRGGGAGDTLRVLSVRGLLLEADAVARLCDVLPGLGRLEELTLAEVGLSANALRRLGRALKEAAPPELKHLSLAGNPSLGPRGTRILSESFLAREPGARLTHLDLSRTAMGHFGAQALSLPPHLQTLLLRDNGMGHDGVWKLAEPLQALEHLQTLDVSSNQCLDDGCLELARHLSGWTALRYLNLADNDVGDVGVEILARELEGTLVRELYLQDNQITDAGATHLAERLRLMPNLQILDMSHNRLQDPGCIAIARGLVHDADSDSDSDSEDSSEEDEDVDDDDGTPADDADMEDEGQGDNDDSHPHRNEKEKSQIKTAKAEGQTKLKVLNLSRNAIGDEGAGAFVELLDDIPSLQMLDLTGSQVSEARTRILDVLLKHRHHDQQRLENDAKPRPSIVMSPTPKRPARPEQANLENVPLRLLETEEKDSALNGCLNPDGRDMLKKMLDGQKSRDRQAIRLPHDYFNRLTGNFSPKRIITYSPVGNLYVASDEGLEDTNLAVRSLYMHTAGALDEVRAAVIAELKHIRHENILGVTAQTLGPSLFCFLYVLNGYKSLREILENQYDRKAMSWPARVKVLGDVAKALEYCHAGGGPHRKPSFHGDVNPSNIFVSDDFSHAKLSGCGLSRLIATDRSRFLSGDAVFGARGYRCPRYERGSCQYDAASDMFAFGIVAAEILTGCLQGSRKNTSGMSNDVLFDNLFGDTPFEADPEAGPVVQKQVLDAIGQLAGRCMNPVLAVRPSASAVVQFIAAIPGSSHQRSAKVPVDTLPIT